MRTPLKLVVALATVAVAVFALTACGPDYPQPKEAPAKAVEELLELRAESEGTAKQYERLVESTMVASALAEDSAKRTDDKQPIPDWKVPVVVEQAQDTATVRVDWVKTEGIADWTKATTFKLVLVDGDWKVANAVDSATSLNGQKKGESMPESPSVEP